ncbi:type II secretion system protein [Patescibacteria group bacterium]|nr:type II secretion system protein [Patescibacteria group bacterium]
MNKGFTLIELIVVMSIIAILSSILFLGTRTEEKKLALQRSAYVLTQDLREVQEMAMGAGEVDCNGSNANSFGIHFKSGWEGYYILFADCNDNQNWDGSDKDNLIRKVDLEKGVEISDLAPASSFSVVFDPPDPITYINQKDWGEEAEITLQFDSGDTKKIKINSVGRIEIE